MAVVISVLATDTLRVWERGGCLFGGWFNLAEGCQGLADQSRLADKSKADKNE